MKKLNGFVLACVLAATPVLAEGSAKEHFDRGMISYNLQDWPSALRELRAAYAADPQPSFLFTIGQAQRLSGDCEAAILTYRSYLRGASPGGRAAAEGLIRQCEATVERTRAQAEQQRQQELQKQQELLAQQQLQKQQQAALPPVAPVVLEKPAPLNTTWYADPLGDVLAIAGLGAVGGGVALLVLGNGSLTRAGAASAYTDYLKQVSAGQPLQLGGVLALSGGGALLVGALIRYLVVGSRVPAPAVGLIIGERSAAFTFAGHF
jgi:hypothetical protein